MYLEFIDQQKLLFIAMVIIIIVLAYSYYEELFSGYKSVDTNDAVRIYNDDAVILDVRSASEYKSGFIENAINIAPSELKSKIDSLSKYKQRPILVYCQSGGRSAGSARALVKAGFANVNNLAGGILSWKNASLPIITAKAKKKQKKKLNEKAAKK